MFLTKRENSLAIDWGRFYKNVFALVIPMALQNLINVGVTAADVIMLGKVGETVLSGASLAGQIQYVMTLFLFGLTSGATVLTAQYWGKGDVQAIEKILALGMKAAVAVTALFTFGALFLPGMLMQIFTSDPKVIGEGVKYLQIIAFSYVAMGITQVYLYIMRSVERVIVATVVYLLSLLCNVVLNAVLIFGMLGFPAMGIRGAAIATLVSRLLELALVCGYARIFNRDIKFRFVYFWHNDRALFADFMKYALPVVINEVMWGLGTAANTAVLGHMGSAAVAANSVAQVARQLATVVTFGMSSATAIYLGKTIGEKKPEHAKAYAQAFSDFEYCNGNRRRRVDSGCGSSCDGASFTDRAGEGVSPVHVLCHVLLRGGAGIQHDYDCGCLPLWRRHAVRTTFGCDDDVVLLHPVWGFGCVCLRMRGSGCVCDTDERRADQGADHGASIPQLQVVKGCHAGVDGGERAGH